MVARLAAAEPLWEPGTKAGYHALTWGFLAGELIRRTDGRSLGRYLAEEVAGPLGAEFYIGVPDAIDERVAEMVAPLGEPTQSLAEMSEILKLTLLNPYVDPCVPNRRDFRAAELPALNGTGNANGIARIYASFANGGSFQGVDLLSPDSIQRATRLRFEGTDINTGVEARWSAGFFGNNAKQWYGPNPEAFGHSGWGGSMGYADPVAGISVGYAPNQMDANLNGDPRGLRLVEAVYACLADS
jgi:CubicO group peptidase (beta-lactamase class C family)